MTAAPPTAARPSAATPAAALRGITQRFDDTVAVDNVDIDIAEGKLTTLLGPSGCGKTTTLRILAGYQQPTSGVVNIAGRDATRLPPEKRNLGMVFQSYALFPHLTVEENVAYGLKLRKLGGAELRQRVRDSLELVGLAHLAGRKPRKLSGGQQQRVALARAVAIEPDILLLDEPLSNLDARLRVQMRAEIRRIKDETGLTVVLVTHDQEEALEMSDVIVLMRDGHVEQAGAPDEVFARPRSRFVADFLGYENFFADGRGGLATVRPEHLLLTAAPSTEPAGQAGPADRVEPEPADVAVTMPATVRQVAYRGVNVLVRAEATDPSGATVPLVAEVPIDHAGTDTFTAGQTVRAHVPRRRLVPLADEAGADPSSNQPTTH